MRPLAKRTHAVKGVVIGAIVAAAITGGTTALSACLDMTPIEFAPAVPEAAPPPPPIIDAGPDVPDVDTRPPCELCLESPDQPGPGCADELAACRADTKCKATYDCVLANGCLTKGSQKKMILCGLPCAENAGILTQDEPAAVLVLKVVACVQGACASACKVGDAGID